MKRSPGRRGLVAATGLALLVASPGCAGGTGSEAGAPASTTAVAPSPVTEAGAQPSSDAPFGTGCGGIPPAGEGSFAGMADDPVATAVANNPAVRAFADALRTAHLAGPLDSQEGVTVLAPANAAFEAVPADARGQLLADTARLTAVLTHHVIVGRLAPDELPGTHTTLNNDQVTVEVSPEAFSVAAEGTLLGVAPARVVCGNVQTANATIYIVDQVLAPPAP